MVNQIRISPELIEKVKAEAKDYHEHQDEDGKGYIHYHLTDTPTRAALEILLQSQKEMIDEAWDLFQKTDPDNVKDLLDIVGSVLYSINLTYEVNMKTLRLWHHKISKKDLTEAQVDSMVEDINKTLGDMLGREIDITTMSVEDMDAVVDEAANHGLSEGLEELSNRLDRTAEGK